MIKSLFCVRDKKGGFGDPMVDLSDYQAMRAFESFLLNNPNTVIRTHPADFRFCRIGHFDTDTGELEPDLEELETVPQILDRIGVEY